MSDLAISRDVSLPPPTRATWGVRLVSLAVRHPLAAAGLGILLVISLTAALAPHIAPYPYTESHVLDRLQGPSQQYWLGTDQLGRDVLSRLIAGARPTIGMAFTAVLVSMGIAIAVGLTSGYFGGVMDVAVQRIVDVWMALPGLILVITLVSILGNSVFAIAWAIGIISAANTSRIIRADVLRIRRLAFVESAVALGGGHLHIVLRHILPNIFPIIIVLATMQVGSAILIAAAVSFLGYGVPPPQTSWGAMLSTEGRAAFFQEPLLAVWPGLAITITVWAANMLGDGLRDILDPRLRH